MLKTTIDSMKFVKGIKNLKSAQSDLEKAKAAQYILDLSNKHGGMFAKIIQLLGNSNEQIESLKQWQRNFESNLSVKEIEKIVTNEFGKDWNLIFSEITDVAFCASIGQVNKAYLTDGSLVALKIQYPNVEKSIKDQLKLLKILPVSENFGPMKKWEVQASEYYQMIYDTLNKELNYLLEVNNQSEFAQSMKDLEIVKVAKIYPDLVSKKCYVQEFLHGDQVDQVIKAWTPFEKEVLAKNMLKVFLFSVFEGGIIHEDSNHYNYIFQKDPIIKVCVLDFGQCIRVDKNYQMALLKLFDMTVNQTNEDPFGYLVDIGFDAKKLKHIHLALPVVLSILFDPFISKYNYDLKTWDYKNKIEKVLGDAKWWFRSAGGVKFFEIMKAFMGIKSIIERLEVKINWNEIYHETLQLVNHDWKNYQTQNTLDDSFTFDAIAQHLKIKVSENGVSKVDARFPARVLLEIEEFIDNDVLNQLAANNINIQELIRTKMSTGLVPGEVFSLKSDNKEYKVWLE